MPFFRRELAVDCMGKMTNMDGVCTQSLRGCESGFQAPILAGTRKVPFQLFWLSDGVLPPLHFVTETQKIWWSLGFLLPIWTDDFWGFSRIGFTQPILDTSWKVINPALVPESLYVWISKKRPGCWVFPQMQIPTGLPFPASADTHIRCSIPSNSPAYVPFL